MSKKSLKKSGRHKKVDLVWYQDLRFLQAVLKERSPKEVDNLVMKLFGIKSSTQRFRFCSRVTNQNQSASLTGTSIHFSQVMTALKAQAEFAAIAQKYCRPIFSFIEEFPESTHSLNTRLRACLKEMHLARTTFIQVKDALDFKRYKGWFRPEESPEETIRKNFEFNIEDIAATREQCIFQRINLITLLFVEALVGNELRLAGYLLLLAEKLLKRIAVQHFLGEEYATVFRDRIREKVFDQILSFRSWSRRNYKPSLRYIGAPITDLETYKRELGWHRAWVEAKWNFRIDADDLKKLMSARILNPCPYDGG